MIREFEDFIVLLFAQFFKISLATEYLSVTAAETMILSTHLCCPVNMRFLIIVLLVTYVVVSDASGK